MRLDPRLRSCSAPLLNLSSSCSEQSSAGVVVIVLLLVVVVVVVVPYHTVHFNNLFQKLFLLAAETGFCAARTPQTLNPED